MHVNYTTPWCGIKRTAANPGSAPSSYRTSLLTQSRLVQAEPRRFRARGFAVSCGPQAAGTARPHTRCLNDRSEKRRPILPQGAVSAAAWRGLTISPAPPCPVGQIDPGPSGEEDGVAPPPLAMSDHPCSCAGERSERSTSGSGDPINPPDRLIRLLRRATAQQKEEFACETATPVIVRG